MSRPLGLNSHVSLWLGSGGFGNNPEENFQQNENFVKSIGKKLLTMIFSENFLSVEIFLEWKWASRQKSCPTCDNKTRDNQIDVVKSCSTSNSDGICEVSIGCRRTTWILDLIPMSSDADQIPFPIVHKF